MIKYILTIIMLIFKYIYLNLFTKLSMIIILTKQFIKLCLKQVLFNIKEDNL